MTKPSVAVSQSDGSVIVREMTDDEYQSHLDSTARQPDENESAIADVKRNRHAAYAAPDGPDAIFLQWQRGDATEQDWLNAVQAVKDAHPKP